jgi:hypothetical protein
MRAAWLVERATLLVATAVPALALEAPAHAAGWVTHEVGIGGGVSVVLGRPGLRSGRTGGHVYAFYDSATSLKDLGSSGEVAFSAGGLLAFHASPQGQRVELKARAGPGWTGQATMGHVHFATVRPEVGFAATDQGPSVLLGADARGLWGRGELLRSWSLQDRKDRHSVLNLGLEMGFVPLIVDGRPLRDGGPARRCAARIVGGRPSAEADRWLESGRDELEAVSSFVQLARELQAAGAPESLVARCLAAADEEVVHAALCFGRAAEISGGRVAARPLRPVRRGRVSPARLAAESFWDGVVNEGSAAAQAADRALAATCPRDAAIHERIARDEAGHAALGAAIHAWGA